MGRYSHRKRILPERIYNRICHRNDMEDVMKQG